MDIFLKIKSRKLLTFNEHIPKRVRC